MYGVMIGMGLSSNVIAYIKNVNVETVRKNQRRIRDRLSLKKGTDLKDYFNDRVKIKVDKSEIEEFIEQEINKSKDIEKQ